MTHSPFSHMACVCFLLSLLVIFFIYSESIFSANLDPTYFRKSMEIDDKSMPRTIIIGTYTALAFLLTLVKQLRTFLVLSVLFLCRGHVNFLCIIPIFFGGFPVGIIR